jgi:hypothetical protein
MRSIFGGKIIILTINKFSIFFLITFKEKYNKSGKWAVYVLWV